MGENISNVNEQTEYHQLQAENSMNIWFGNCDYSEVAARDIWGFQMCDKRGNNTRIRENFWWREVEKTPNFGRERKVSQGFFVKIMIMMF